MFDSAPHLPAADHPELLGEPVRELISLLPDAEVFRIDPALSDTESLCREFGEPESTCGNCVIVRGRRGEISRTVACLALATTRVDVNKLVRKRLDVRKASFAPMDEPTGESGMEYGAITPIGLPREWPIWIDPAVVAADEVCIGAGTRSAKLILPGTSLLALPNVEVVEGLAA